MGIQDLQSFLENEGVGVDLFHIARNHPGGLRLVLDAEGCLDRLYGGFFSDWACGGQWARCIQFLTTLAQALAEHQVSLCVCFNGSHPTPPAPPQQWIQTQAMHRQRVNSVLRHIQTKGTPPPKVWWVPPTGLHSCLRTALRYLNIPVMVSSDDHYQEVVGLCREKSYHGLIGNSGEYLVFQPPRYFSSSQLKLTYRSSLETREFMTNELVRLLEVPQDRLCLAAALLGGSILSEQSLADFYRKLGISQKKTPSESVVKAICKFVSELPSNDVDAACVEIFGDLNDLRAAKLKQAVQYYLNGTKDGFLKYRTPSGRRPKNNNKNKNNNHKQEAPAQAQPSTSTDLDTTKLATESSEHEQKGLEDYKLATANASLSADLSLEDRSQDLKHALGDLTLESGDQPAVAAAEAVVPQSVKANGKPGTQVAVKEGRQQSSLMNKHVEDTCPQAPAEVLRTCAERHARGLMYPQMLSILTHRQVTLSVLIEDDMHREIPSIHHFYRPIRQNVYAILYNMHHHRFMAQKAKEEAAASNNTVATQQNQERPATVLISEWIYSRVNPGKSGEIVPGVMLDWPVPTVQRLWFGTAQDDKCRRMRAFLSCMRSDTPLMLNTSYVPQHLLILATVLRYIMTSHIQILRRQELDAFLATAFSNDLMNALHLQEMTVTGLSSRGVQVASLVMAGVEAALLANESCGAPVPWLVAAPWLYFDGKLLQRNLARAAKCRHAAQLCDKQLDVLVKVERMRKAILEGLEVEFAMPPIPMAGGLGSLGMGGGYNMYNSYNNAYNNGYNPMGNSRGAGRNRSGTGSGSGPAPARLEIAGVVVGQWGGGTYPHRSTGYSSMNYVGYTVPPRNAYSRGGGGARGGRGGARGGRGGRGGRPQVGNRRNRADKEKPHSVNGKPTKSEEPVPAQTEDGNAQDENATAENDTNGSAQQQKSSSSKGGKNSKKNSGKGKKKATTPKADAAQAVETNGPLDKTKVSEQAENEHIGQGDAPVS